MGSLLSPSQVAKLLDAHPATVRRWAMDKKLRSHRVGWSRVFELEDVQRFAEERRRGKRGRRVTRGTDQKG